MKMTRQYLSMKEVAAHFGVSASTVARWVRDGDLRTVKIGGRRLAHIQDVEGMRGRGKVE